MKKLMPQEIEVWYLIPAIRRELSKIFLENYNLTQKRAAEILGITGAAVSQYISSKRAIQTNFTKKEMKKISEAAKRIIENPNDIMKNIYDLCVFLRETKIICEIHKNQDKSLPKNCNICFKTN